MKSFLLLIFFSFLVTNICFAQKKAKETVSFRFDTTSTQKCKIAVAGEGYQNVNKYRKRAIKGYITFSICNQKFGFETDEAKKVRITKNEKKK